MSDKPEKKHPWAKFQARPGGTGTPKADVPRRPAPVKPALQPLAGKPAPRPPVAKFAPRPLPASLVPPPKGIPPSVPSAPPPVAAGTVVSEELAAALNKLAAEYAIPAMTNTPFVTAVQRAAESREQEKMSRLRRLKIGAVLIVAAIALHFTVTRVLYRTPSDEALAAHLQNLPALVLPSYSSTLQLLQAGKVAFSETDRIGANRIRYAAEVTLQLPKPLYVPASTNGTDAYRQLQEALQMARQRDLKFNLFPAGQGPAVPELPRLLQVSHRAGESVVVRMPFEARRFGWQWRLDPAQIPLRSVNRALAGSSIERYASDAYLIFGASGSMAEVRQLMQQARVYITAVTQAVQKQADAQAIVEPSTALGTVPSDKPPAVDPDLSNQPAISLEELQRLFDPNAPAVTLPGVSPVPPAVQDIPAVPEPKRSP